MGETAVSARSNEGVSKEDTSGSCNQCQSVIHPYMFVHVCVSGLYAADTLCVHQLV